MRDIPYNLSELSDSEGFADMIIWLNNAVEGIFGIFMLLSLFIVMFAVLQRFTDTKKALGTSTFICAIISVLMRLLGILTDTVMWSAIIILMIVMLLIYLARDRW